MCTVYLLLNEGTNSEVHDGWKSNLEPVQKEFFQSWKNAKTTDVHIGCNRIQVEFEYNWDFNCLSYLYNLAQYSNRGPQLLQRMTFAHQKTNDDAHQFTCYCQLYGYRRGNDKISLSHLFTDWGRLGHGPSCLVSIALIEELCGMGHSNFQFVLLEEQLAIFLYASVTGFNVQHLGEMFQRSNDTISKYSNYFHIKILVL